MKKLVFLVIVTVLLAGCSSVVSLNKSTEELKEDIIGETIGVVTLSDENVRGIEVISEEVLKDTATITAKLNIEHLIPHSGALNKDLRKNDVIHIIQGEIKVSYIKNEQSWIYNGISDYKQNDYRKEEIEVLMERIEFSKTSEEVLQDLKDKNIGIKVVKDHVHTITFGQNDTLGYKAITNVETFEIANIETLETNDLLTKVTVNMAVDYKVENSIFDDNGEYSINGNMDIIYKLEYNTEQNEEWVVYRVENVQLD